MSTDRPTSFLSRRRSAIATAGALSILLLTGGCYFAGGPGYSADRFTYPSHSWAPQTVSLIDTRTDETLWSVDVPVGQQLVVNFIRDRGDNDTMADMMQWRVMDLGRRFGPLDNRMSVPPYDARLLDVRIREPGEMPGAVLPERGPAEPEEIFIPVEEEEFVPMDDDDFDWSPDEVDEVDEDDSDG